MIIKEPFLVLHVENRPVHHLVGNVFILANFMQSGKSYEQLPRTMNVDGIFLVVVILGATILFKEIFDIISKTSFDIFVK